MVRCAQLSCRLVTSPSDPVFTPPLRDTAILPTKTLKVVTMLAPTGRRVSLVVDVDGGSTCSTDSCAAGSVHQEHRGTSSAGGQWARSRLRCKMGLLLASLSLAIQRTWIS